MNKTADFFRQTFAGKTIYRVLFNWQVKEHVKVLSGRIVDLAGGGKASYYPYFPSSLNVFRTNYISGEGIDAVVDLNSSLPFKNGEFDGAVLFNAIYIMKDPLKTLKEIRRILKPGGTLLLSSPFVANEMPEPDDFWRFTAEGLNKLFLDAGFTDAKIARFGERFSSMAYIAHPYLLISPIRAVVNGVALILDKLQPRRVVRNYPFPLGYFCYVKA